MAIPLFANRIRSALPQPVDNATESIPLTAGDGAKVPAIPAGQYCPVVLAGPDGTRESCFATAINGDVLTVQRGQEGSVPAGFPTGTAVYVSITAQALGDAIAAVPVAPADGTPPLMLQNNAQSALVMSIGPTDTQLRLRVGDGARFPAVLAGAGWFPVVLIDPGGAWELCRCTASTRDILTVQRGVEGTTARSFPSGTTVRLVLSQAGMAALYSRAAADPATYQRDSTLIVPNFARSRLRAPIAAWDTVIVVDPGHGSRFPVLAAADNRWFPVALTDVNGQVEFVRATSRTGDAITVKRARDGTQAKGFPAGSMVDTRLSMSVVDAMQGWTAEQAWQEEGSSSGEVTPPDTVSCVVSINSISVAVSADQGA